MSNPTEKKEIAAPRTQVDEKLTRQVAELARLDLSDEEVKLFTAQLGDVMKYVEQLQTVNVDQVEPLTYPLEEGASLREDHVVPPLLGSDGKPKTLQSAPDVFCDGFKVPPILSV